MKDKIIKYVINSMKNGQNSDLLLSEKMMAAKFNCSRSTVVNAYNALKNMGLIKSKKGKGWFINPSSNKVPIISQSEETKYDKKTVSLLENLKDYEKLFSHINIERSIGWNLRYFSNNDLKAQIFIFIKDRLSTPEDIEKIKSGSSTYFIEEKRLKVREIRHNIYYSSDKFFNEIGKSLGYKDDTLINHYTIITMDDEIVLEGVSIIKKDDIVISFNKQWYK